MIDINKKYKTRNGLPARIVCVDRKSKGDYPIVALVKEKESEHAVFYTIDGLYIADNKEHPYTLIEVTPYDHIKPGDLVMCWNGSQKPKDACLRKFAGVTVQSSIQEPYDSTNSIWDNCMLVEHYVEEFM